MERSSAATRENETRTYWGRCKKHKRTTLHTSVSRLFLQCRAICKKPQQKPRQYALISRYSPVVWRHKKKHIVFNLYLGTSSSSTPCLEEQSDDAPPRWQTSAYTSILELTTLATRIAPLFHHLHSLPSVKLTIYSTKEIPACKLEECLGMNGLPENTKCYTKLTLLSLLVEEHSMRHFQT